MTRLTRPAMLLLLLVFVCLSSAQDEDMVEVYYAEETIVSVTGSSVKLSCEARYDFKRCDELHAAWNKQGIVLTDPRKYLTTVFETVFDGTMRRRQIVTEILNLQQDDIGDYQCYAECDKGGNAVGHLIHIDVKEPPTDMVEVHYAEETITAANGSSVKLSCEARYDFKRCKGLHVAWNKQNTELTDPKKYLTTVIETVFDGTMRRRRIVTEILNLQLDDIGDYQCNAECDNVVEAMGLFIHIDVREPLTDMVEVYYAEETITAASGSSVKLSCEARYDLRRCKGLRAAWKTQGRELTDPRKYKTTVTETEMNDNMRSKQIVTKILNLQPDDASGYQCYAECDKGDDAVGHFININVKE